MVKPGWEFEPRFLEMLAQSGEVTIAALYKMSKGNKRRAWQLVGKTVADGVASVWIAATAIERKLELWEVAALVRNRIGMGGEEGHSDRCLVIRHNVASAQTSC